MHRSAGRAPSSCCPWKGVGDACRSASPRAGGGCGGGLRGGDDGTPGSVLGGERCAKWTNQFGTDGDEVVASVGTSRFSEVYVAGTTDGAFAGTTNAGDLDGYVTKLDKFGNRRWTKLLGSTAQDEIRSLAVGYGGDVVVVGSTDGQLTTTPNSGGDDAFLARYDRNGKRLWVRQFGTGADDVAWGVVTSPATGAVYVVGTTDGGFPNNTPGGSTDGFLARYDRYGNRKWLKQFGTAAVDEFAGYGVAVSAKEEIYVAGDTFGAFAGHDNAGGRDPVLLKFTSKGALSWTAQFGTPAADYAWPVVVATKGNVYVTGYTEGSLAGSPNAGGLDAFVVRYTNAGVLSKTRTFATPGDDTDVVTNVHLALLPSGALVVASSTDGVLPGEQSAGGFDALVIALSTL